jgi:hypothetical protein
VGTVVGSEAAVVAAGAVVGAAAGCAVVPQATAKSRTSMKGTGVTNLGFLNQGWTMFPPPNPEITTFRYGNPRTKSWGQYNAVLACCQEVCWGLDYLHYQLCLINPKRVIEVIFLSS